MEARDDDPSSHASSPHRPRSFFLLHIKKKDFFLLDLKLNSTAYEIYIGLGQVEDLSQQ